MHFRWPMASNIYIDGFNLYYGAVRGSPFKWLNLAEMCRRLLPNREIKRIRYFTARVVPLPHDQQAPQRQDLYLRALQTVPNLSIHLGRFSSNPSKAPIFPFVYHHPSGPPEMVQIMRTEEKRSDVNLATLLLLDCFNSDFDEAVIISNDSDLTLPVESVVNRFNRPVGIINPHYRSSISRELSGAASWFYRRINKNVLANSLFPTVMTDTQGQFTKPSRW